MNILIPASGAGKRFAAAGYKVPKPFIDVEGEAMLLRVTRNVTPARFDGRVLWLVRREHEALAQKLAGGAEHINVLVVNDLTQGAACTALLASEYIDNDEPLLIANADQLVDYPIDKFLARVQSFDGGILTFPATDPKWSFVRTDADELVQEVAEKIPISDEATVGIYWFKRGCEFCAAAQNMIAQDIRVAGEFYIAPTFNELIGRGKQVHAVMIAARAVHGLGTPEDLAIYLRRSKS